MDGRRIAINGFGRVGRHFLRAALVRGSELEVVAINDLNTAPTLAHMLQYDTVHSRLGRDVQASAAGLEVGGRNIAVLHAGHPATLPWSTLGVDAVVECTGMFTARERAAGHLVAGASRVFVSAPIDAADITICVGVNEEAFRPSAHRIVSNASCTTNCVAVLASVLHNEFGIESGWATTVHAYTNSQQTLDSPDVDFRMGRAAAHNIVPAKTGADRALEQVIPSLAGKIESVAVRVPVPNGSLTDLTCRLSKSVSAADINACFAAAAHSQRLEGILGYTDDPIVSSDVIGDSRSCVLTGADTKSRGNEVKVFGWYDNEWGYANRLLDLVEIAAGLRPSRGSWVPDRVGLQSV
jgi:glyceraldehyde 3-phosphate dehydrogenase